jgi:hypothetical protein
MKPTNTAAGSIQTISFKKFLELVPIRRDDSDLYQFNTCLGYSDFNDTESDSTYVRTAIYLSKLDEMEICKIHLVSQAKFSYWLKRNLEEMVEDAAIASLERYGVPSYLVRISPRTWLIADPNDFVRVVGKLGNGLACYQKQRTLLFKISHNTEESVLSAIANSSLADGTKFDLEEVKKNLRAV